jgi:hypothetical protein
MPSSPWPEFRRERPAPQGVRPFAMRYSTTLCGYACAVLAVAGVAFASVAHEKEMTARQKRDLNVAIDRIVADHNERKRLAVAVRYEPQISQETDGAASKETPEAQGREGQDAALTVVQSTKRPGRRAGRRHDHFLPLAFASLPKFTAYTLLGLR